MNNLYRNSLKLSGIFLAMCIVLFFTFIRIERINRYKAAIPEKIKIDRTVLVGQEGTPLIFALFPSVVRASSCGGAIFKLSQSTIDAIKSEGLSFFEDINKAREKNSVVRWKETPVPYTWTSDGAWIGLACIGSSGNNDKLIRKITKAAELPGAYYVGTAKNSNFAIVVLPKLGLVVHNRNN